MDVHALRHTFGTHLSRGGVAPRTAQAAMRHSTLELTMQAYTDPKLLDVAGAVEVLPNLPLDGSPRRERQRATGTDGRSGQPRASDSLVPVLVPKAGNRCTKESLPDETDENPAQGAIAVSDPVGVTRDRMTSSVTKRRTGLEPVTAGLEGRYSTN